MVIRDGFPGQKLVIVPRPQVVQALNSVVTGQLLPTDAGYFPKAQAHGVTRERGIRSAVVIVCVGGAGWCSVGGEEHTVRANQVIVLPPGAPHSYGASTEDPWTLWWVHVAGAQLLPVLDRGRFRVNAPVREITDLFQVVSLMEEIVGALVSDPTPSSLVDAAGATWHLMTSLMRSRPISGTRAELIERARRTIHDRPAHRHSVASLASTAGMSESHFAALFKLQVGSPVLTYQTGVRMALARDLLDTTSLPVAEIAAETGYADPFYFSRQFKTVHGVTPLAYRRHTKG